LLLRAQSSGFSDQNLGFQDEALETVVASGPCCDRFGDLLAKRLLYYSEHSSLHRH
jgi:hypothetical protein